MGSTSCAMMTSDAFLASMRATQWFRPYLTKCGFFESCTITMSLSTNNLINGINSHLSLGLLLLSCGFRNSLKTSLLLLLCLRAVLVQKLEQLGSSVLVQCVRELSDGGGNFETLAQDDFLTLKADIFRPFDETSQVTFGPHILACMYVTHQ